MRATTLAQTTDARIQDDVGKGRILVVDDDRDFAEGLELVLSVEDYDVAMAHSASEATEILADFDADIALIDIRLAGSSGINLISRLKELRPGILCVMMTAFASTDNAILALQEGAYDYLRKPIDSSDLLATLHRCFERQTLERQKSAVDAALRARNHELVQINERLQLVVHSMRGLTNYDSMRELCPRVLEEVARNMAADGGSVYLLEDNQLVLKHALDPGHAPSSIALPLRDGSVFEQSLKKRQPILIPDLNESRSLLPSGWTGYGDRSMLAFPLVNEDGNEIGVLSLHAKEEPPFTEQDRDIGLILISFACETMRTVKALEDLAVSEARFRSLVETCPIGIQEIDLSGKLISMNRAGLAMCGIETENAARGLDLLALVTPGDRKKVSAALDRAATGKTVNMEYLVEIDGTARMFAAWFTPLVASDEAVGKIMAIVQDITERNEAEEQLRQAQKMEAVGQLTGGVAHDFNNLLAIILGNAELAAELIDDNEDLNTFVGIVKRTADRGAELTKQLLAFSRRQPLRPQVVNMKALIADMTDMLGRTLGATIEIRTSAAADLWQVLADPGQVENAILNLSINARDAMPTGGLLKFDLANATQEDIRALERTSPLAPGDYVVLTVSDNGKGMPLQVLERVIEPFFTTKEVGEGSGLGLSMVYGFVKQSGGHMRIDSEEGRGTTIRLYLPRPLRSDARSDDDKNSPEPRGRGETILVVEDDPDLLNLTIRKLSKLGYHVIGAAEARSAREVLKTEKNIDLLISDVVLPGGVSGPAFAEEAKAELAGLKVIFMSGYPGGFAKKIAVLTDSEHLLLNKPFSQQDLAEALRTALDGRSNNADGV